MGCTFQNASDLGSAVGGWATLLGVLFAVYELTRRRKESLREKRSEAARSALVDLTRATDALDAWLAPLEDCVDVDDPDLDLPQLVADFEKLDAKGREAVDRALQELHLRQTESYVHLEPAEATSLWAVRSFALELREHLDDLVTEFRSVPDDAAFDVVRRLRSEVREARSWIMEQLMTGANVLQPIARLAK